MQKCRTAPNSAGQRRTASETPSSSLPEAVLGTCRVLPARFGSFRRLHFAEQRSELPEAAPWLARGVLVFCCWWLGAAR
eukprot:7011501-Alexandrium_andersonii.AAC.1